MAREVSVNATNSDNVPQQQQSAIAGGPGSGPLLHRSDTACGQRKAIPVKADGVSRSRMVLQAINPRGRPLGFTSRGSVVAGLAASIHTEAASGDFSRFSSTFSRCAAGNQSDLRDRPRGRNRMATTARTRKTRPATPSARRALHDYHAHRRPGPSKPITTSGQPPRRRSALTDAPRGFVTFPCSHRTHDPADARHDPKAGPS